MGVTVCAVADVCARVTPESRNNAFVKSFMQGGAVMGKMEGYKCNRICPSRKAAHLPAKSSCAQPAQSTPPEPFQYLRPECYVSLATTSTPLLMFQENAAAPAASLAADAAPTESGHNESRRQFINHAGL